MRIKKQRCSNCEKKVPIKHILNTNYGVICRRCYNTNLPTHPDLIILENKVKKESETKVKVVTDKICPSCQIEKPFEAFGNRGKGKRDESRWLNSWCLECRCKRSKLQRQQEGYREKHAAYMREYRKRFKQERLKPEG